MIVQSLLRSTLWISCLSAQSLLTAQDSSPRAERASPLTVDPSPPWRVVIAHDAPSVGVRARFLDTVGGVGRMIRILATSRAPSADAIESALAPWRELGCDDVAVLDPADVETTRRGLEAARGIWLDGVHFAVELDAVREFGAAIGARHGARSLVVGASGDAVAWLGDEIGGAPGVAGFALLQGMIVARADGEHDDGLRRQLQLSGDRLGIALGRTALEVLGRRATGIGRMADVPATTRLHLPFAESAHAPTIEGAATIDLVQWVRAAAWRQSDVPDALDAAAHTRGTLVLGGSLEDELPAAAWDAFLAAATSAARARDSDAELADVVIAILPDAARATHVETVRTALRERGLSDLRVLTQLRPRPGNRAPRAELPSILADVDAVWIVGGDAPWSLVDHIALREGHAGLSAVLARGGAIAACSSAMTPLGSTLLRGGPLDDHEVFAPGYEQGFGILPGIALEPHSQSRERTDALPSIANARPPLLVIGIDDATAAIVRGARLEVVGPGKVSLARAAADAEFVPRSLVADGGSFDFVAWRMLD